METDFQQGCCPFHLKLTVVISLTNSDKNNNKKKPGLSKQLKNYFILFVGLEVFSPSTGTNIFWFKSSVI